MTVLNASVWDRIIEPVPVSTSPGQLSYWSLAQYTRAIARDMEVLLNTRVALSVDELAAYPACADSIVNFGLADFAQLCLTSSENRKTVCDLVTDAIGRHEPRLIQVRARLVEESGMVNRLSFAISARLRALADEERVQFDVMLESSNLHYSIR
jgi:type VI secretion system protein ImpF